MRPYASEHPRVTNWNNSGDRQRSVGLGQANHDNMHDTEMNNLEKKFREEVFLV